MGPTLSSEFCGAAVSGAIPGMSVETIQNDRVRQGPRLRQATREAADWRSLEADCDDRTPVYTSGVVARESVAAGGGGGTAVCLPSEDCDC